MKNEKCAGCAFTKGTEANSEPHNHIKGLICMLAPVPFYCHSTFEWKNAGIKEGSRTTAEVREDVRANGMNICQGWREQCAELAETGYYKEGAKPTKIIGKMALETVLKIQEDENTDEDRKKLFEELGELFDWLSKKWKKYQNKSIGVRK